MIVTFEETIEIGNFFTGEYRRFTRRVTSIGEVNETINFIDHNRHNLPGIGSTNPLSLDRKEEDEKSNSEKWLEHIVSKFLG